MSILPDELAPKKLYQWRGRPVTDLTKEELVEALETMGQLYVELLESRQREYRFLRWMRSL